MDWIQDCRGCMKKFKPRVRKYSSPKTMQMFYYCINKKFSEEEDLPKQFCYDCYNTIHTSFKFIKRARKAQTKFENLLYLCKTSILPKSELCIEETIKSNTGEIMISPKPESLSVADSHKKTSKGIASEYKRTSGNMATCFEPKPEISQENTVTLKVETQIKQEIATHPKLEFLTSEDDSDQNVDEVMAPDIPNDDNFSLSESSDAEDKVQSQQRLLNKKPAKSLSKKQHECTKCTRKFNSKLWLTKHMRKDHVKINQCPKCTKTFARQTTMKYHIDKNSCTKKTYDCEVCGRQFDSPRQLPGHMTKHVEYWTFSCDQCPRRFNKQSRLDAHLRFHKAGKVDREFLCSVCGTSFNNSGSLTIHMRLHTGERPYSCSDCPKRFSTSSGARKHEQTHRRNFYYTCDICQKRFTEKGSLDRHLRAHSGEHPYQCTYCECAFGDNWKKKVHMMRAHNLTLDEIPRKKGGRPPFASKPIQADTTAAEIRTNVESQVEAPE